MKTIAKVAVIALVVIAIVASLGLNIYSFAKSSLAERDTRVAEETAANVIGQIVQSIDANGEVSFTITQEDGSPKSYTLIPKPYGE